MFALLEHKYAPTAPASLRAHPTYIRLTQFYVKFAPEKLKDIPGIMREFQGREAKMWRLLQKKYVLQPHQQRQQHQHPRQQRPQQRPPQRRRSLSNPQPMRLSPSTNQQVKGLAVKIRKRLSLAM